MSDVLERMKKCRFPELTYCGDGVTVAEAVEEIEMLQKKVKWCVDMYGSLYMYMISLLTNFKFWEGYPNGKEAAR